MAPSVTITSKAAARVRAGYPWVYPQDLSKANATEDLVQVLDPKGKSLGTAMYAAGARLPIRMIGSESLTLDGNFFRERITSANARRKAILPSADAYRVVHGEADRLPGLIVDRYGDVAVMQTMARGMDAREPAIAKALVDVLGVRLVVARDDGAARDFEGLERRKGIVLGQGDTRVEYHDSDNLFSLDVLTDGKTGGFLDQVENHARAKDYAFGEALDTFSYHGGFALALGRGGATSVLGIDESPEAVARAKENATRNKLDQVTFQQGNAFDVMRTLEGEGRRFDVVVVDPPAFAKRKSALAGAERAYKELNLRGLRLLRKDGILVSCSCSGKLTIEHFSAILADAVADVGRPVQILERRGAGRDHPPLMGVPETEYLKCWILRVIG